MTRRENPHIYIGMLSSSPIGALWTAVTDRGLLAVDWSMSQEDFTHLLQQRYQAEVVADETQTGEALRQLAEYLAGDRREFELPLDLSGMSAFQQQVLRITADIPYGKTMTYKEIAILVGKPQAARAVGRVQATNPIPLVIPCHRVVGSDSKLHGYGGPGGIKLKSWLLQMEGVKNI